jgi:hypothetical protein
MRSYQVECRGKRLSVDAIVEGDRVRIFSVREHVEHGYFEPADDPKASRAVDKARSGQTHHEGSVTSEAGSATALSAWSAEDRRALIQLVRVAATLTNGMPVSP